VKKLSVLLTLVVIFLTIPISCSSDSSEKNAVSPDNQPGIVGDPNLTPTISITNLQPGDATIKGTANNLDTAKTKVVLWAKTDRWYIQPFINNPYTYIQSNGSWSNTTHPWNRMVALLVDSTYVTGSIMDIHPSSDSGVLAWDEYPAPSADKYINWSGYRWRIKNADLAGPGPNYFSNDPANVWLDSTNRLHLKFNLRNGKWYCAEVVLDHSLGYGTYTFKIDSRIDSLNYNAVFAGFVYETTSREIDMEWSQLLSHPFNAQCVIQPWNVSGNINYYEMPTVAQSTHQFIWHADTVFFRSWNGHDDTPKVGDIIHEWTYTGASIPPPGGERMRFNLWLFNGEAPTQNIENEIIIKEFHFQP